MNVSADRIRQLARDERLARRAGFWWGFAEGVCFFIVPDVYVSFAALFSLRAGIVAWVASIAGSLAGVVAIYLLAVIAGFDYVRFLDVIPGISATMLSRVRGQLGAEGEGEGGGAGLPYTALLILGGVPLKVYAGLAFSLGFGLAPVLLWTVFARIVRIAPTVVAVAATRLLFRRSIDARATLWCALLGIVWLAFYVFYFVHMSRS
jgi:hypothetical protein